jgi:hypothetical protein
MARFKYAGCIERSDRLEFDIDLAPDALTPVSGVYRCKGCGREEASRAGAPLPPRDHHRHTRSQGLIRWTLIVAADPTPK